eukprot:3362634-Rhodomonas_salina.1
MDASARETFLENFSDVQMWFREIKKYKASIASAFKAILQRLQDEHARQGQLVLYRKGLPAGVTRVVRSHVQERPNNTPCVESDLVEQQRPSDVGLSEKGMESFNGTCLGDEFEECFVWKSSSNTSIRGNYFRGVVQVRFRVLSGVYTAASVVATRLDIVLGWKNLMSREMGIIVYNSTEGQFVGTANDYQSSLSGKTLENVHVRDFAWHYAT